MTSTVGTSRPVAAGLLEPPSDPVSAGFWDATSRGELTVQTCAACGTRRFPPRPMCPACRSVGSSWVEVSGDGTIWSFVVPQPPLLPAYAELAPYVTAVVQLDADPAIRMVGRLVDADGGPIDTDRIHIGGPVSVRFERHGAVHVPVWAVADRPPSIDDQQDDRPEAPR